MAKPCSWYTVYSAKTDEIIASGTADMIVQQMGYASRNSFFSAVCHAKHKKDNPRRALHLPCGEDPAGGHKRKGRYSMKIIIEEIGDRIAISFTGKGKKSDRIKLLMMVMVETLVDGLVSDLTDAQLQDAASIFANEMKTVVIARYKMNLADRKEEFTGKEAAFLSKLFNL